MDEVFVCGPEGMIETTCQALMDAGVPANRVHAERFASASTPATPRQANIASKHTEPAVALTLVLDGKTHHLRMNADERILDVALSAGLGLAAFLQGRCVLHLPRQSHARQRGHGEKFHAGSMGNRARLCAVVPVQAHQRRRDPEF
jgi:hypothetical protein